MIEKIFGGAGSEVNDAFSSLFGPLVPKFYPKVAMLTSDTTRWSSSSTFQGTKFLSSAFVMRIRSRVSPWGKTINQRAMEIVDPIRVVSYLS